MGGNSETTNLQPRKLWPQLFALPKLVRLCFNGVYVSVQNTRIIRLM